MVIDKVGGPSAAPALEPSAKGQFGKVWEGMKEPAKPPGPTVASEGAPRPAPPERQDVARGACEARAQGPAPAGTVEARAGTRVDSVRSAREQQAVRVLEQVTGAQHRLDQLLAMAESGRSFSPAELLAVQAQVYQASQELDLAGKVVEKATGGIKQVLQTQV